MKIICPACRVPVAAEDVNLGTGLAKCRTCNNVFRFDALPELAAPSSASTVQTRARGPAPQPRSVTVSEGDGALTVEHRWFGPKYIFLTLFCLFWDGFLVAWYFIALHTGNLLFVLFPLIHVAVGIVLTYATVAGYVNRTTLRIDGSRLAVRHHPLPWPGNTELAAADVRQLFCEERISRSRNGPSYTYNLVALLADGSRKKVVAGLDSPSVPLFLEQHAEAWMRIGDQAVAGELPR
jgi:hypothetical protein